MKPASKEKILKKVRKALLDKSPAKDTETGISKDIYAWPAREQDLDILFAEKLIEVAGMFIFCENEEELVKRLSDLVVKEKWQCVFCHEPEAMDLLKKGNISFSQTENEFDKMDAAITQCEFLIARTGSVMVSSNQMSGRRLAVFPPVHIVLAKTSQVVPYMKDALDGMMRKYNSMMPSMITAITGPSRTADIEKTLILGAHGPKELYVFMIDDKAGQSIRL